MPTVAEQLRAAREAHGLTVHEVADITKIKTDHVRALEEGRYDAFAAPVYIRGFVRTYSRLLHLNPETTAADLDTELRQAGVFAEPDSTVAGSRGILDLLMLQLSKVNWRVALPALGLAIAILLAITGFRWWSNRSRTVTPGVAPSQYQSTQPDPAETLPLPPPNR